MKRKLQIMLQSQKVVWWAEAWGRRKIIFLCLMPAFRVKIVALSLILTLQGLWILRQRWIQEREWTWNLFWIGKQYMTNFAIKLLGEHWFLIHFRMSLDFDLIAFYQTYTKYCHLHKERTDTFNIAKVCTQSCSLYTLWHLYRMLEHKECFAESIFLPHQ